MPRQPNPCHKCGGHDNPDCLACYLKKRLNVTRQRYIDTGLCHHCGKQPAPGRKLCEECLEKMAKRYAEKHPPRGLMPPHLRELRRKLRRKEK